MAPPEDLAGPRLHGPYWYAAWREGPRVRTAYVGTDKALERFQRLRGRAAGDIVDDSEPLPGKGGRTLGEMLDSAGAHAVASLDAARRRRELRAILAKPLDTLTREELAAVLVAKLVRRSTPKDGHARGRYILTNAGLLLKGYHRG